MDENHQFVGPDAYSRLFDSVDYEAIEITTERDGLPSHVLHVYRCYGFKPRRPLK